MAESALEPSNQALAPATPNRVAAPNAAPAPASQGNEPIIRLSSTSRVCSARYRLL